ncbi:Spindle pole protein, putative [Giardia duodenalis ATCC 50581]|nr:Spindle pole protein, putative [Giardia intestinalis ATCC 50581]
MGIKTSGREAQGSTPKMRKPPLKARTYTAEDVTVIRRASANPFQRLEDPTSSASLAQRVDAGDSLSSSSTPYDPTMSTYCSTSDAQKHVNLSIQDASVLEDTSMHSGFSREHTIKASSMSELYPVSEHFDLQERSSNTRGTPLVITSPTDQQAIVTHRIHSNYTSTGITFVAKAIDPRASTDMNSGIANRTQDSSIMSVTGPEPAENLSFTGMEPRASYSRVQRIPVCIDENDNVALSDSVQEMMAAMTRLPHQDKNMNLTHELSAKDHTLSGIKNSVVYNSQAHNVKSSDNTASGDTTATQKMSQVSNDISLSLPSAHLNLSLKNQADSSQCSGLKQEILEDCDRFPVPSAISEASAFAAVDQGVVVDLASPSHKKAYATMSGQNDSNTELKMLLAKSDEKGPNTPKFSLSSAKCLPIGTAGITGGDRIVSSVRSVRPSITNTYDYHDYTTTDDFRSDPVLSDLTATRSTLVQFGNYTVTSQNNSDCGVPGDCKDMAYMCRTDPVDIVEDGIELGLSEIRVQPESVQFVDKQHSSPSSVSVTRESYLALPHSTADHPTDARASSLDVHSHRQEACVTTTATADVNKSIQDTLQTSTPKDVSQKELPKQPSLYKLESSEQPSAELMRQFQQFQLFQQFQQFQRMQGIQGFPENYQYIPQNAVLGMQPFVTGLQPSATSAVIPKTATSEAPCTPISNPRTGPGRPSSARSPYPGIDSRIGGASPFDKAVRSTSQTLLKPNLNITESAIDIVNDVVNALDEQGALEDAPNTQLNRHLANLATDLMDKESGGPGTRNDAEPSESFMTERLRNLSRLSGYKIAGKEEFILQQTIPKNVADTSIYRYMTNTQKSRFAESKDESSMKILQPEGNNIMIKTYEDSCAFVEDIRQSLSELRGLSPNEIICLLKQVMLGAIQQHKLLTSYRAANKLQDEQATTQLQQNADELECQSPTRNSDTDLQVQTLKANLRKALTRNATLVAKLEEYAERIKEYKRQEKQLAKIGKEREQVQHNVPKEQLSYIKASPRRT